MERKYRFLRDKYYGLLLPTLFMVMSEKIAVVIDVIMVGIFIGGSQLAPIIRYLPYFILPVFSTFFLVREEACWL